MTVPASIIRGVNDSNYVYPGTKPPRKRSNKQEKYNWLTRSSTGTFPEEAKNFNTVSNTPAYLGVCGWHCFISFSIHLGVCRGHW